MIRWTLFVLTALGYLYATAGQIYVIRCNWTQDRNWHQGRDHQRCPSGVACVVFMCGFICLLVAPVGAEEWRAMLLGVLPLQMLLMVPGAGSAVTHWLVWRLHRAAHVVRSVFGPVGSNDLHCAVESGSDTEVVRLLDAGANPNAYDRHGCTPLHIAAQAGEATVVSALVRAGADPDRLSGAALTPLQVAAVHNTGVVASHLLRAGADPNLCVSELPALWIAAEMGHTDVAQELLRVGVNPNRLYEGETPLHHAVWNGDAAMVDILLAHGADPTRAGHGKGTPIDEARTLDRKELLGRLTGGGDVEAT